MNPSVLSIMVCCGKMAIEYLKGH
uniref:Uncharacterized protein n=1 Tax=Arundo donax TaxID=35708 RepID=A0A0A9H620_ARUDO